MSRFLFFLLKLLFTPLLGLLGYCMIKSSFKTFGMCNPDFYNSVLMHPYFLAYVSAIVLRICIGVLYKGKVSNPLNFVDTMEHELTHSLFGYLTFSPPLSLLATLESGGEVKLKRKNVFIVLSPYFFPLWGSIALVTGLIIKEPFQPFWNIASFILLGNFCYRICLEFRWHQTDLTIYGRFFSLCFIFCLWLSTHISLLYIIKITDYTWFMETGSCMWTIIRRIFF